MKRFLAIALALVLVVAFAGCGKSKKRVPIELTLSTEDSEAILKAAGIRLPDETTAPGAGSHVIWYAWYDPLQNYEEDQVVNTGNWTFTHKYNGSVEWLECVYENYYDDLAMYISAGTPPDATQATNGVMALYPMNCIKEMIQPVDKWIDFDDPLFAPMKGAADYFTLRGEHYHIITDIAVSNVVAYNRRVIEEYGYDDPATLYWNDEWTWNEFYDMCMDFTDPDADRYALDGYAYAGGLMESTGQMFFGIDNETGKFYANIDSPEIERSQDVIYNLVKNGCTYQNGGWALRGDFGTGMNEGLTLFYVIAEWGFTGRVEEIAPVWGDVGAGELMFAPLPRDPNGDGVYYMRAGIEGYSIVENAKNPEGVALLAMCDRFKKIDPVVIQIDEKQLKEKYLWSDEMIQMHKECYRLAAANPVLDINNNLPDNLGNALGNLTNGIIHGGSNPSSWAQLKESYRDQIEYYVEELNNSISDYNNG